MKAKKNGCLSIVGILVVTKFVFVLVYGFLCVKAYYTRENADLKGGKEGTFIIQSFEYEHHAKANEPGLRHAFNKHGFSGILREQNAKLTFSESYSKADYEFMRSARKLEDTKFETITEESDLFMRQHYRDYLKKRFGDELRVAYWPSSLRSINCSEPIYMELMDVNETIYDHYFKQSDYYNWFIQELYGFYIILGIYIIVILLRKVSCRFKPPCESAP